MNKEEFKEYISKDNPGFYKTRQIHLRVHHPDILDEINNHISKYDLHPVKFNDAVNYYLNDITTQVTCKICGKIMFSSYQYCSNKCKNQDIQTILGRTHNTLYERNGSTSPLGSKEARDKRKKTCLDIYGVEHPSSNKDVKDRIQQSNIDTYSKEEVRKKHSELLKAVFTEERKPFILKKRKMTNFLNTGEYVTLPSVTVKKIQEIFYKKYGTTNPFLIHDDTYKKAVLGCKNSFKNEEIKNKYLEKRLNSIIKKYGSWNNMCEYVFNKSKNKILKKLIDLGFKDEIIKYEYSKLGFVTCKCSCGHEYDISFRLLRHRTRTNQVCCTVCNPAPEGHLISIAEMELFNWLSEFIECEQSNRKILEGKEIDILVKDKNIGIEYNGVYWHSDLFKDKDYHLNKTMLSKIKGYNLIHIWEDLWENKKDIVKGKILSFLDIKQIEINSRDCYIKDISFDEASEFLNKNDLDGNIKGIKYIALIKDLEIMSIIVLGKTKYKEGSKYQYEILRFCNRIGIKCKNSFRVLFDHIVNRYPGNYVLCHDLSWGEGEYDKAGFDLIAYSRPIYWYFIETHRFHRFYFSKKKLVKMGFDKNKSEFDIMDDDVEASRVYDCGRAIWEYTKRIYK